MTSRSGFTASQPTSGTKVPEPVHAGSADRSPSSPPSTYGADAVIGDCAVYTGSRRLAGRLSLREAGETARLTEGFVWVGLRQPTADDIAEVAEEFGLPALAVDDAVRAHQRPKLEVFGDVVFVVLKPVDYIDHDAVVAVSEIAMFLGTHFIVTVRHGDNDALRQVRAKLDTTFGDHLDFGSAEVLYRAADIIVDGYETALQEMNIDVDQIESVVFGSGDDDHAERIYKLKREVGEFRRAVLPLARPLELLMERDVPHIPSSAGTYFRDVHDHLLRAADDVDGLDRRLTDVLQANTARVTTGQSRVALRQNEDTRKISAWAAIALVPTAIAGVYGMNFDNIPELHWHYGYFVVLAAMVAVCLTLYRLFRRRGWL